MADSNNRDDELELPVCDSQPTKEKSSSTGKYVQPSCVCFTKRFIVAMLIFLGLFIDFGMRKNTMLTRLYRPVWTPKTEFIIHMSYFWSYLITQLAAGILSTIYPANRIFGIAIACSSFLNLLLPELYILHPVTIILIMILQGVCAGALFPACYGILRFWSPPLESSRFVGFIFSGSAAGILGLSFDNVLTLNYHWSIPFYIYGAMGIIWFLFWNWLVFEKPASHPTISVEEKTYIEETLNASESKTTIKTIPWKNIFTSMPVYAIIVANFCYTWTFSSLVFIQVLYLRDFGFITRLILTLVFPIGGVIADFIRKKNILSTTNVRKVFSCGGLAVQGLLFLILAYFVKTATEALIILNIGVAFSGLALSGFNVNHFDIAPRYAGTLMGLSQGIGGIAEALSAYVILMYYHNRPHTTSWTYVFLTATCIHFITIIFYAIFASGELQPWAEPNSYAFSKSEESEHADDKTQLISTEPPNYGTD